MSHSGAPASIHMHLHGQLIAMRDAWDSKHPMCGARLGGAFSNRFSKITCGLGMVEYSIVLVLVLSVRRLQHLLQLGSLVLVQLGEL